MTPGSKDWLDMLSSVGEAAGIVALVGLVFEIYRREEEKKKQRIPLIEIGAVSIETTIPPENAICCLCEELEADLPLRENDNDYREMWFFLKPTSTQCYLRIPISNNQLERDGRAEAFRLRVQLEYSESPDFNGKNVPMKIFWCPKSEIAIPPGKTETIFIRCGMPTNDVLCFIKGEILDYKCQNARGDSYIGSSIGFDTKPIYSQRLTGQINP